MILMSLMFNGIIHIDTSDIQSAEAKSSFFFSKFWCIALERENENKSSFVCPSLALLKANYFFHLTEKTHVVLFSLF